MRIVFPLKKVLLLCVIPGISIASCPKLKTQKLKTFFKSEKENETEKFYKKFIIKRHLFCLLCCMETIFNVFKALACISTTNFIIGKKFALERFCYGETLLF